jgi:hypothetical protein
MKTRVSMQKVSAAFCLFLLLIVVGLFSSCTEPCTYPDLRSGKIRLINAMVDVPKITVFINGKVFKSNYDYEPLPTFGYYTTMEDGSPIIVGDSLPIVVTSDAAGRDTVMKKFVSLDLHLQTLIVAGRNECVDVSTRDSLLKIILTDDEEGVQDPNSTQLSFVHAIPDLSAIDVYLSQKAEGTPFATLDYGEFTNHDILPQNDGITVTEAGNPSKVIFSLPYGFNQKGFFIKTVIRGATKPVDSEPLAAPFVMNNLGANGYTVDFETTGIRFANGMRNQQLSLLVTNPNERVPRNNVPGQAPVLDIGPDSIGKYFGIGTASFRNTYWFFSRTTNGNDTIYSFPHIINKNERWTMVAVAGKNPTDVSHIALLDTMSCFHNGMSGVRVVNISPDHNSISFSLGGKSVSLQQKGVDYFMVSSGSHSITFTDGTTSGNYTLEVPATGRPITIFILPDKTGKPYPVSVSYD